MKILCSGYHNPRFPSITEYVEDAFRALGHAVVPVDNRRFALPGRLRRRVRPLHDADLRRLNRRLVDRALAARAELFLETGGHRVLPESVDALRAAGIRTVLWTIDAPTDFAPVARAAPHYDAVVCGGTEAVELLDRAGVTAHWLPFACDPARHRAPVLAEEDRDRFGSDVAFVGSCYPNRAEVLAGLAGLDLAVWGPGWDRLPAGHPLEPRLRGGSVPPGDWVRIYAASRIVLVVHFDDGRTPCRQASPKLYEALACGAFVLVDDQPDVFSLFEDGVHLTRFEDGDDLRAKVQHYLARPHERLRIAQRGHREAVERHTYRHRVERLLSLALTADPTTSR